MIMKACILFSATTVDILNSSFQPEYKVRGEYRTGDRVAPLWQAMASAKPRELYSIFAKGCSIWSDNSNQADMMNATNSLKGQDCFEVTSPSLFSFPKIKMLA